MQNCVGTALYILGMQHADVAIAPAHLEKYLPIFEELSTPAHNSLIIARDMKKNNIRHVGVITIGYESRYLVAHRVGTNREFQQDALETFLDIFDGDRIQYYHISHTKIKHCFDTTKMRISKTLNTLLQPALYGGRSNCIEHASANGVHSK